MATFEVSGGYLVHVDDEDMELVRSIGSWTAFDKGKYVHHTYPDPTGVLRSDGCRVKRRSVFLHRVIMGLSPQDPRKVDHRNRNGLDNRRENLRIASSAENAQNKPSLGGSSRHRGVGWHKSAQKWEAYGQIGGRKHYIGVFEDENVAAAVAAEWRQRNMPFAVD